MQRFLRILIMSIAIFWIINLFSDNVLEREIPYSQVRTELTNSQQRIERLNLRQDRVIYSLRGETENYYSNLPFNSFENKEFIDFLNDNNFNYSVSPPSKPSLFASVLISMLPLLFFVLIFYFILKQTGKSFKGMVPSNKNFQIINPDDINVTFDDVAGINEMKHDVMEVVDFLKQPDKYMSMGSDLPKGVLLTGSPGTGKTLLAKAMAKEAGCHFLSVSGSDFVEMYVGLGASRVRKMFKEAKENRPCIIFIDEIDAIGKKRGNGMSGGNDEREQTLNQLLVDMNGFKDELGIVVIGATNRPETLDSALIRPGRFDRVISVPLPSVEGREQILKVHASKKRFEENIDFLSVAKGTVGFSGADLANLINEASILATRIGKSSIDQECLELAKDKIIMGAEMSGSIMSDSEKELTAYHESGHAIIGHFSQYHDPVHKVSIVPRGKALGVTVFLPEKDKVSINKLALLEQIQTLYGGRIAEEIIYGKDFITTGASNDIERATIIASKMVKDWGMSSLGAIHIDENINQYGEKRTYSQKKLDLIDDEIKSILDECYKKAQNILLTKQIELHKMAHILLEKETIDKDEIKLILGQLND